MDFGKVCVIIPTFNRFTRVLNAIRSVKNQTYKHIDIIVVNDASTDPKYYSHDWAGVTIMHLPKNTKQLLGFACPGYCRNRGLELVSGRKGEYEYVAFLDDDDFWMHDKIEKQIIASRNAKVLMCSTNGKMGKGLYHGRNITRRFHQLALPTIWTTKTIVGTNYFICSSVLIHISLFEKVGMFMEINIDGTKNIGQMYEDYEYWKSCLKHTNSIFVNEELVYYETK